jgi:WD40 repeat protein
MTRWLLFVVFFLALTPTWGLDQPEKQAGGEAEPEELQGAIRLTLDVGGHTGPITVVLFTPDGKQLITSSADYSIRIWDVETGEPQKVLRVPRTLASRLMALSPDGRTLAVGSFGPVEGKPTPPQISLINLSDERIERTLEAPTRPGAIAFSPDGARLAVAGANGKIRFYNLATGKTEQEVQAPSRVIEMNFSPDGTRMIVCHHDGRGILDLATGKVIDLKGGPAPSLGVWATSLAPDNVAWSPDGKILATCAKDGLRLWNPDGKLRAHVLQQEGSVQSALFSKDSRQMLATTFLADHRAIVLNARNGKELRTFSRKRKLASYIRHGALSPDGKYAATAGIGGGLHEVLIWETATGEVHKRLMARSWLIGSESTAGWTADGKSVSWVKTDKPAAHKGPAGFDLSELHLSPALPAAKLSGAVVQKGQVKLEIVSEGKAAHVLKKGKVASDLKPPEKRVFRSDVQTLVGRDRVFLTPDGFGYFLFDANTGASVPKTFQIPAWVMSAAPSPDGRYLLVLAEDQVLRILEPDKGSLLLSFYLEHRDWIAWTPEGYYASSEGGERLMGWTVESRIDELPSYHPASRFRAKMYRPDVIKLLLKEGSVEKALAAANAARGEKGQVTNINQVLPPEVTLTTTAVKGAANKGKLQVKAEAKSQSGDPIVALQLLIDERPYTGEKGLVSFPDAKAGTVSASWEIALPGGQHDVRVLARTRSSLGSSRGMGVLQAANGPAPKEQALYILAVGIDAYSEAPKLAGAVNDATRLERTFKETSKSLFTNVETKIITDAKASKEGILEGLKWLKGKMQPQDVAVFFFAGHGDKEEKTKEFYLLPQDTKIKDLAGTALSRKEIKEAMQGMPGRIVVLLDACHSGAIGLLFDDLSRELVDEDCGVVVMCAARPSQSALEKGGQGFFTVSLLEGLKDKDIANKTDGRVYLHHLQSHVIDKVMELSNNQQHPVAVAPPWMRPFALSKPEGRK